MSYLLPQQAFNQENLPVNQNNPLTDKFSFSKSGFNHPRDSDERIDITTPIESIENLGTKRVEMRLSQNEEQKEANEEDPDKKRELKQKEKQAKIDKQMHMS